MIIGLLNRRDSLFFAKFFKVRPRSTEELMLINVFNAIVNSWDAKESVKKKAIINTEKVSLERLATKRPVEVARNRFRHVKIAGKKDAFDFGKFEDGE